MSHGTCPLLFLSLQKLQAPKVSSLFFFAQLLLFWPSRGLYCSFVPLALCGGLAIISNHFSLSLDDFPLFPAWSETVFPHCGLCVSLAFWGHFNVAFSLLSDVL